MIKLKGLMKNSIVRINSVELINFKNVKQGKIRFPFALGKEIDYKSSDILGIYGQNGSGKTTFINALNIMKNLLMGHSLSNDIANYIAKGENFSKLIFEYIIKKDNINYKVIYEVVIEKNLNNNLHRNKVFVKSEKLSYIKLFQSNKIITIIDFSQDEIQVFKPKIKFDLITGKNTKLVEELRVSKKLSKERGTSFIFSEYTIDSILEHSVEKQENSEILVEFKTILLSLYTYSVYSLQVVDNNETNRINSTAVLPFDFIYNEDTIKRINISLNSMTIIEETFFERIEKIVNTINIVLCKIIPNVSIKLCKIGETRTQEGNNAIMVELFAVRQNIEIPLHYESDGIKKIIAILYMLINVYNDSSVTLAIDELDSGIYEYLLGEVLEVIKKYGKGQLIFTSHNLRALEVLDRKSIVFTTTNSQNRYIRLKNVKSNNNLRDFYYRDIFLGGQSECLYEPTDSADIRRAFRMAGDTNES